MAEPAPEHEPKPSSGPPVPFMNAMLIADSAIREEGTQKTSLIGIFENITAAAFPCVHPTLAVYVKVTDAQGPYEFKLELIRLDDATKIAEVNAKAEAADRMSVGEMLFKFGNLRFAAPGLYEFRLLANDRFVGSKTFRVVQSPPTGG